MALISLGLVSYFGYLIFRASQPINSVLYTDLMPEDTTAIIHELETRGIAFEIRDDGRSILAPKSDIPRLRLDLATKGIPTGGSVGYEIFDRSDGFSTSGLVQSINQLRAIEGELARSIRTISAVQSARVHLAIPEKRLFEKDREPPRASIALKLQRDLSAGQISAVRRLVASAVEGLKPEMVSVVDEQGRLLADGTVGDSASANAIEERQTALEKRIKSQIETIIASVVGQGRARVQVAAELDTSRIQTVSESFDPESKVARSTQNRNESQTANEVKDGSVSVANELPGGSSSNSSQRESSAKNEEVVNYEISKTTRTEVSESGKIKRISVAVLVDGIYEKSSNGDVKYLPRPQSEIDQINALVKTGIGFDAKRGDQIEVVNLRFATNSEFGTEQNQGLSSLISKYDLQHFGELGLLTILSLIVTIFIARPLLKVMTSSSNDGRNISNNQLLIDQNMKSLDRVTNLIDSNPKIASVTVKQWLSEYGRS